MRKELTKFLSVLGAALMIGSGVASAEIDPQVVTQIQGMEDQIAVLRSRISDLEKGKPGIQHAGHDFPSPEDEGGFLKAAQDIQVGGYLDVQYNQNLTRGGNAIAGGNTGRIFDTDRESFTVNAAELNFTKEANPEGGAGFRIDVQMGEDAQVVNGDGANADKFDLQQAYIEYVQPLSFWADNDILPDSINVKAGRFVTLAGLEVIEGPDNWNISRSFAFGLSIPFVHTGVRTNFGLFNDFLDVYVGVVNGWDNPVDNNKDKTLETAIGYSLSEKVSLFHTFYWGNENADAGGGDAALGHRFLNTNVITFDATDKLSFMGEVNLGNDRRGSSTRDSVQWYSYAAYARYQLAEDWAVAYRGELFKDGDVFRTGLASTLWSQTFTLEHNLADNLIARLEYRYDKANDVNAFGDDSDMSTIGAQVLYLLG